MKILVLKSSPHKNGTSNTLANEFIKGADSVGHKINIVDLSTAKIKPCQGCNYCGMNGNCVLNDDGNQIINSILESDALLVVFPIYYYTVPAQLKVIIDRFYSRTTMISNKHLKIAYIATAWDNDNEVMYPIQIYLEKLFKYMNFQSAGYILGKGCGTVSMINDKYYKESYELGRNI